MKKFNLSRMQKGWFVGDFLPSCFKTKNCEVALKTYKKGDKEGKHFHKVAAELTLVVKGRVKMNGAIYKKGDIVLLHPKEASDFEALEDSENVVVKIPSVKGDKYKV